MHGSLPTPREQHNKSLQLSARVSTGRISCRLKKLATFFQIGAATELYVIWLESRRELSYPALCICSRRGNPKSLDRIDLWNRTGD